MSLGKDPSKLQIFINHLNSNVALLRYAVHLHCKILSRNSVGSKPNLVLSGELAEVSRLSYSSSRMSPVAVYKIKYVRVYKRFDCQSPA